MSRVLARQLPDGRRAEVLQDGSNLVRVVFYAARTGRMLVSQEYGSLAAALMTVDRWVSGEALPQEDLRSARGRLYRGDRIENDEVELPSRPLDQRWH